MHRGNSAKRGPSTSREGAAATLQHGAVTGGGAGALGASSAADQAEDPSTREYADKRNRKLPLKKHTGAWWDYGVNYSEDQNTRDAVGWNCCGCMTYGSTYCQKSLRE